MGTKDVCQSGYLDDPVRFADQVNGALFGGRQVVKAQELEEIDPGTVYQTRENGRRKSYSAVADKTRLWRGQLLHIITLENQSYVDYRMVLRNMLSESIGYHKQWRRLRTQHERAGDLKSGTDEYLSGMKRDEKLIPIVTLVVYCGTEHIWDGAKSLHELLEIDEEMKTYVSDYRLNLYDCRAHESFSEYRTGLRQVFETVRYGDDKRKLKELMEENREAYENIDSDTREMIEVMANVKIPEEYGRMVQENDREEKRYNMCKAFEDYRQEGVEAGMEKGREEGRIDAARRMLRAGRLSYEEIAEYTALALEEVQRLAEPMLV